MRNLKRVLSLALALVMVLGMMVITTSAATYTDADEITYEEAIAVMSGVGLYEGNPDGSLKPTEVLTREQAATIITRLMLGKAIAATLAPTQQIFSDVAVDRWSAAAIEYCYNIGMIDGLGDGTFDPTGELTGTAFAKLLLCALGYDAAAEGYTGKDWKKNINADALAEGLYIDGVKITDKLTREGAAQMVLQVLEQKTVRYVTSYDYSTQANVVTGPWDNANTFAEKYFPTLVKDETVGAYDDMWGRPAEYAWVYGKVPAVLWTEWEEAAAKYTAAVSDCQIAVDMGLKADAAVALYTNGVKSADYIDVDSVFADNGAQGAQLEIYDGRIVRIDTYLAEVTDVVTELKDAGGHLVRSAKNTFKVYDDVLSADTDAAIAGNKYAKNDMILVNYNAAKDKYVALGKAESFVGAQTFIWWAANKHTVAGIEYNDACQLTNDDAGIDLVANYTWYKDQFGNIIGAFKINTPKTYGIVEGVQWVNTWGINGYAQANVRYMDGTTGTVTIKAIGTNPATYADYTQINIAGGDDFKAGKISTVWQYNDDCMKDLYLFTKNIDGTYSLTEVGEVMHADVKDGISAVTDGTNAQFYTDNYTTYLIQTQNRITYAYTYTVVTGYDNLENNWAASDLVEVDYVLNPVTGYAQYVYITGPADTAASKYANGFVYFTNASRYYGDAMQNNIPCFVIGGVVRADGTTDVIYVAKDAAGKYDAAGNVTTDPTKVDANITASKTMAELSAFLDTAIDNLYLVKTTDGVVASINDLKGTPVSTVETDLVVKGDKVSYAHFVNKGNFAYEVEGNGVLKIFVAGTKNVYRAYNINASTAIINQGGKGTVADLTTAALAGKSIYVVGAYDVTGTNRTTQALTIFITNTAIVAPNPNAGAVAVIYAANGRTYPKATLADAVAGANTAGDKIVLQADITLASSLTLPYGVTLDGNGHTITYTAATGSAIVVDADDTVVKNLTVKSTNVLYGWDGKYGIQVYTAKDVVLENVTATGFDRGILLNGSEATLKGVVNVSGNDFAGIEVSKGSGVTDNSILTVAGTVVNANEATVPTAMTEAPSGIASAQGSVAGTAAAAWTRVYSATAKQIYWFMNDANVTPAV